MSSFPPQLRPGASNGHLYPRLVPTLRPQLGTLAWRLGLIRPRIRRIGIEIDTASFAGTPAPAQTPAPHLRALVDVDMTRLRPLATVPESEMLCAILAYTLECLPNGVDAGLARLERLTRDSAALTFGDVLPGAFRVRCRSRDPRDDADTPGPGDVAVIGARQIRLPDGTAGAPADLQTQSDISRNAYPEVNRARLAQARAERHTQIVLGAVQASLPAPSSAAFALGAAIVAARISHLLPEKAGQGMMHGADPSFIAGAQARQSYNFARMLLDTGYIAPDRIFAATRFDTAPGFAGFAAMADPTMLALGRRARNALPATVDIGLRDAAIEAAGTETDPAHLRLVRSRILADLDGVLAQGLEAAAAAGR